MAVEENTRPTGCCFDMLQQIKEIFINVISLRNLDKNVRNTDKFCQFGHIYDSNVLIFSILSSFHR